MRRVDAVGVVALAIDDGSAERYRSRLTRMSMPLAAVPVAPDRHPVQERASRVREVGEAACHDDVVHEPGRLRGEAIGLEQPAASRTEDEAASSRASGHVYAPVVELDADRCSSGRRSLIDDLSLARLQASAVDRTGRDRTDIERSVLADRNPLRPEAVG